MAQNYECVLLLKPTLADENVQAYQDQFSKIITEGKGELVNVQRSNKRRLEFVIGKQREAIFVIFYFRAEAAGAIVQEMERQVRINDDLLREMTVKVPELRTVEMSRFEAVPIPRDEYRRRPRMYAQQAPAAEAAPAPEAAEAAPAEQPAAPTEEPSAE